ncbi:MAG: hypothetical protein WC223_11985 [Bacteroidales bacterium]|jgi:transcriptional regulator of arginine metabolism
MESKTNRLIAIRKILETEKVNNQDTLQKKLKELGFYYTQATLSRDLKFLKVAKIADVIGEYRLVLPEFINKTEGVRVEKNIPLDKITSMEFSNNIVVIRTFPGYANGVASTLDGYNFYEIIGSVAGDDTLMLILREGASRLDFVNRLITKEPNLKEIIPAIKSY